MKLFSPIETLCFLLLLLALLFESKNTISGLSDSFRYEIKLKRVDLLKDPPHMLMLLPGVGSKKAQKILEIREQTSQVDEILEKAGLSKKVNEESLVEY